MLRACIVSIALVAGCLCACTRSDAGHSVSFRQSRSDGAAPKHPPVSVASRPSRQTSAMDRLNQTLESWVKAADRASVATAVLRGVRRRLVGADLWKAMQSCHCLTKVGWYPYFLGMARLADMIAALTGQQVSRRQLQGIVHRYNETALAYNAVRTASPFLPRSRVALSDLDPGSFNHWLDEILLDLRKAVRPNRVALLGGDERGHVFEASVRALWIAERTEMSLARLSRMSCRRTRPCRPLETRRDRLVGLIDQAAKLCKDAARVNLLQGFDKSRLDACLDSWKRLDARLARTQKVPPR